MHRLISSSRLNRVDLLRPRLKSFKQARLIVSDVEIEVSVKLLHLVNAFRIRGHFAANLDPLETSRGNFEDKQLAAAERRARWLPENPNEAPDVVRLMQGYRNGQLDLEIFGLKGIPLEKEFYLGDSNNLNIDNKLRWSIGSLISFMSDAYCGSVGVEFGHIENEMQRQWLIKKIECNLGKSKWKSKSKLIQLRSLDKILRSDHLEKFLGSKFPSSKRFGIEGCESLLPGLWSILEAAVPLGVEGIEMGMAHRGRLNVLHNFLGKSLRAMCNEFSETELLETGDVKYHLGTREEVKVYYEEESTLPSHTHTPVTTTKRVHVSLAANPSHLEAVNPVVIGKTKAKQFYVNDFHHKRVLPILLHGDAAFSGQGIVPELMELSALPDYTVGGSIHVIINNQIGFTTDPKRARTSYHCTNAAKGVGAPIFHVNGDDVDAVVEVCRLAAEWRQTFSQDCVVDIVCYRRHGHNELDDPMITQPMTYNRIKKHPTTLQIYSSKLLKEGLITTEALQSQSTKIISEFEQDYEASKSYKVDPSEWLASNWQGNAIGSLLKDRPYNQTGVSAEALLRVGYSLCYIPQDIEIHGEVLELLKARRRMMDSGQGINMAFAEALAFGTLMTKYTPPDHETNEPHQHGLRGLSDDQRTLSHFPQSVVDVKMQEHPTVHVRLSGQDCIRGTFNQRHATIYCQKTSKEYVPLNNLSASLSNSGKQGSGLEQASLSVCNSSLSEAAVLGFEYGYSLSNEMALTIWEAQFGDFANVAQAIIDNFIASGESKWSKSCGSALVLLLPHGYDGQGPEHSSARLERFLQLADDDPDEIPGKGEVVVQELMAGFDVLDKGNTGRISRDAFRQFIASHSRDMIDPEQRIDLAIAELFSDAGRERDDFVTKDNWVSLMSAWLQRNSERRINICVVQPSTPAQYFHCLRRQIHRSYAKPLVVMSPKWLLHHKRCSSSIDEFLQGTFFQRLIVEGGRGDNFKSSALSEHLSPPHEIKRLIFCSGKIFYHLLQARAVQGIKNITLVRLEQLAPFPYDLIEPVILKYPNADLVWVQEEPKNMGAWSYVKPRLETALRDLETSYLSTNNKEKDNNKNTNHVAESFDQSVNIVSEQTLNGTQGTVTGNQARAFRYIGRKPSASAATGSYKVHVSEMKDLIDRALKL